MVNYLAIETSCDETAAAVVKDGRVVLSNCLVSQIGTHQRFGGVVPEVAAREHVQCINEVIAQALDEASLTPKQLDGIACTVGPGLIGTLLVGLAAAKALSWSWDLPLIGVDHLISHVCANYLETNLSPPFIALLVSGGHTQILHCESFTTMRILGETVDDAAGEAFDKVARLLGLGYPGGPLIDELASQGDPSAFKFPEGVVSGFDFSFSGLKTAVLRRLEKTEKPWPVADLAASFQEAVTRVLVRKTLEAQKQTGASAIVLAGGVAANRGLRHKFLQSAPVPVFYPPAQLCTDNAAMVAAAAYFCGNLLQEPFAAYSRSKDRRSHRLNVQDQDSKRTVQPG
jgi:N6-L-threonylcarbamoyladenine synthase